MYIINEFEFRNEKEINEFNFRNEYELAREMIRGRLTSTKKWGILEDFSENLIYKKYSREMMDKYVRGKSMLLRYTSAEFRECEEECISLLIERIKKEKFYFPLKVKISNTSLDWTTSYITEFVSNENN